jgi:hypothetical protein
LPIFYLLSPISCLLFYAIFIDACTFVMVKAFSRKELDMKMTRILMMLTAAMILGLFMPAIASAHWHVGICIPLCPIIAPAPVVVAPAPVVVAQPVVAPAPVVVAQPVIAPAPVVVAPAPVVYAAPVVVAAPVIVAHPVYYHHPEVFVRYRH